MIHAMLGLALASGLPAIGPVLRPIPAKPRPRIERRAGARRDNPDARQRWEWEILRDPRTGEIPRGIRTSELEFARSLPTVESLSGRDPLAPQVETWVARGPVNIAGRVRALALDRSDVTESTLLAGGVSGGMWRSVNAGVTWVKTTTQAQLQSVTCVAQDTRNGQQQTWYYGTGERLGNSAAGGGASYLGDGVFKSTDSGQTWTVLPSTSTGTPQSFDNDFDFVWRIAIDPSNLAQAEVYAATPVGLHRSTDGGGTWTRVLGDGSAGDGADVAVTSAGLVYAANSSDSAAPGIWVSADGTAGSFTNINPPGLPATYGRITMSVSPSNENLVYFLAVTAGAGTNGHSIYRYDRGAGTWSDRSAGLPPTFDSQGGYDLVVSVKPTSPDIVFIGGTNLFRSTSGFTNTADTVQIGGYGIPGFTETNGDYPSHHPDQQAPLVFSPTTPNRMWSGNDGGVYRTDDNTQPAQIVWTKLNTGLRTTQYYALSIDRATAGSPIVVGGLQDRGNFFTSDPGDGSWPELTGGDGCVTGVANGRTFYTLAQPNANISRFIISDAGVVDGGLTTRIDPTAITAQERRFIHPYELDPNSSETLYLPAGTQLWRNTSASTATRTTGWESVLGAAIPGQGSFSAIGVSRAPANRVYLGTDNGQVYRLDNANVGTGLALTDVWTGRGLPAGAYVIGISVAPTNADSVLAVFSNYSVVSVYFTSNGGTSWTAVSGNLEQNPDGSGNGPSVRAAAITAQGANRTYFVGTSTGVYSTSALNGGATVWAQEAAALIGNVVAMSFAYRPVDNRLVVGTHGAGAYSTTVGGGGGNTAPQITASAPLARAQGSAAANSTIATVTDAETAAGNLTVTVIAGGTATGITVTGIVNANGTVTANVSASCTATTGTVRLQVADAGGLMATADLTINVTANTPPTLGTYPETTVAPAAGATVTPNAVPADNGGVTTLTATAPGFTGTLTGNPAVGTVTITDAGPAGDATVTVTATDNCGLTAQATFLLHVVAGNTAPQITAGAALTRTQGLAATSSTLGTVTDAETAAGDLTVAVILGGTSTGITVTNIANANGTITADVAASCAATTGTVRLQVTDAGNQTGTADLTINVTANPPPTLGTYPLTTVALAGATDVTPSAAPTDNVGVATLTATSPGFTGTLTGDPGTGVVTVANAGPAGNRTVTVTATDTCGATTQATFTLQVTGGSTPPRILAGAPITRTQSSPATSSVICTVDDDETADGSLTVVVIPGGTATGITIDNIVNSDGTDAASVSASCTATSGTVRLRVTDGDGLMAETEITVIVSPNTPPILGTYPETTVAPGGGTIVTPTGAPADNGTGTALTAAAPGFAGTFTDDDGTGVLTITNAGPAGNYTVTVTDTDICGANAQTSFILHVVPGFDPCNPDTAGPLVTAPNPSSITVNQSTCSGGPGTTIATLTARDAAAGALLNAFLNTTATGSDTCTTATRLPSRLGTTDIIGTTRFVLGANPVSFRFADTASNVGTAAGTVNVRRQGDVDLSGVVDVFDVITIQNRIVGNVVPGAPPFNAPTDKVADNDNSGIVDIFDVILEANFIVGNAPCLTP